MEIFIGRDHNGVIISIVSAKDESSANSYWQGAGILPYSQEKLDIEGSREAEELGFVTPIVKTKEITVKTPDSSQFRKIRIIT